MITKAVLPVAGLGTRFLPVTKAVPKELLPLVDRPCIAYVVAEAVAAGIGDIVLVTSRGKSAIEDYFDSAPALEASLEASGKKELLREVQAATRLAKVISLRQHAPKGLGHAVLTAFPAVGNQDFAVILPDDIVDADPPAIGQLIAAQAQTGGAVVALKEIPREHTNRYGVCAGPWVQTDRMRVDEMVEKPPPATAPSNFSVVGRYVLPGRIFSLLENTPVGRGGELQLTDAIAQLCAEGGVHGVRFSGVHHDTGNPLGLLEASIYYALKRPEFAEGTRAMLQGWTK